MQNPAVPFYKFPLMLVDFIDVLLFVVLTQSQLLMLALSGQTKLQSVY